MLEKSLEIINKLGLHARASAKLVSTAAAHASSVEIEYAGQIADAKSIMSIMMLAASQGSQIIVRTNGSDEQIALDAVTGLINDYFGEEQ
jgi:phosphocarrier protein